MVLKREAKIHKNPCITKRVLDTIAAENKEEKL